MKFKKKLFPLLASVPLMLATVGIAVGCAKISKTNAFKTSINIGDGKNISSNLSTLDAWNTIMHTDTGVRTFLTAQLKANIYEWVKQNTNVKWNRSVDRFIQNKSDELDRIAKTAAERFGNDKDIAIQNAIYNSFGGTKANWIKFQAIDHAYSLIDEQVFDDKNLLFVQDDDQNFINTITSDAQVYLQKQNPVSIFSNNESDKGYAHFLNFIADQYVRQNFPVSLVKTSFSYDDLKNQNLFNKEIFKQLPEKANQSFPFFNKTPDNDKTHKNYQKFITAIKTDNWMINADNKDLISFQSTNLTDLVNKKDLQTNEVLGIMRLVTQLNSNQTSNDIPVVEGFKDDLLANFVRTDEQSIPGFNKFFYPLSLNNQNAFSNDLANIKQITNQIIVHANNQYFSVNLTPTGVNIYTLVNANQLQEKNANESAFYTYLKNQFLLQTALFNNKTTNLPTVDGLKKLKDFFKNHKDQLLVSYYAQTFNDPDFLFKTNLAEGASFSPTSFNDNTTKLINEWFKFSQNNNNEQLYRTMNQLVNTYNKQVADNVLAANIFDNGLRSGIKLTQDKNNNYTITSELLNTLHLETTPNNEQLDNLINTLAASYEINTNLINPNVNRTQNITFNNYVVNTVFNNAYQTQTMSNLVLRKVYEQLFLNIIDLNQLTYLPIDQQSLINDAINMFIKQKQQVVNSNNKFHSNPSEQLKTNADLYNLALQQNHLNIKIKNLLLNYELDANDLKQLYTFVYLLGIKDEKVTLDNFKKYLNSLLESNDNQLFVAYAMQENTKNLPNFGKNVFYDYATHIYQPENELWNTLNINPSEVYINQDNKIVNSQEFLNNLTYVKNPQIINYTTVDNKIIHSYLGLITKDNQRTRLNEHLNSVDLFDNKTFIVNDDEQIKYKGVLYKYTSKDALISLVQSFNSYNQFYELATELKDLLYSTQTNDQLQTIINKTKEYLDSNNNKQTLPLTFDELRSNMVETIKLYPDIMFTPLQLDYIYYRDANKVTNLFNVKDQPDWKQTLVVSQFNANDVKQLDWNQTTSTSLLKLSRDQLIKMVMLLAINEPTISIQALSKINPEFKAQIFDQRLYNENTQPFVKIK
ncbi:hypothetical protein OF377_01230 [Ureaplasma sp. ES3154-GEN]|uniref:DUF3713 domain-containing protein n=1 Tax=Ureaplasma sp. ES3154-GEN TaxID=2984844 RepID=UPI0021E882B9|nr:DUF3713 domain-containing protein [Ureaplasma sp. ES3154-GEN]MCV3743509.1 hypothetical protein [Ureaplasma sp. ES3154-GEN]